MKSIRLVWVLVLFVLASVGSAAERSEKMIESIEPSPAPAAGMAQVVFVRHDPLGRGVQATLYEVHDIEPRFLGILSNGTRIAIDFTPGFHRLMVLGGRAEFFDAELIEGRTYYVLVQPIRGTFKARFLPRPVRNHDTAELHAHTPWFRKKLACTVRVEGTPDAEAWFAAKQDEIRDTTAEHLAKWKRKKASKRDANALRAEDGLQPRERARSESSVSPSVEAEPPCARSGPGCTVPVQHTTGIAKSGRHVSADDPCSL